MISADFTVNGSPNPAAHSVSYGSTVVLDLLSYVGAESINWEILACSDPGTAIPTITKYGTPIGKNASFVVPADPTDGLGRTFLVKCTVSLDVQGSDGVIYKVVSFGVIGVPNSQGIIPIAPGEENYRHGTHGWAPEINDALNRGAGGGGGGSGDVIGPVSSVDNRIVLFSGTTGKVIKQAPVSISDVILKDGSVTYTANQSHGGFKITSLGLPTINTDAATKGYVDGLSLTVDGTSITNTGGTISVTVNGVGNSQLRQGTGLSVIGRSANTTGNVADITGTAGQVLRVSGTTLGFGSLDLSLSATVGSSKLAYNNLADLTGLSVLGRGDSTTGAPAAITGTDGQVLRVSGTTLGFGTITTASYTNSSITYAKIQNVSATDRILGRDTAGAGVIEELTVSGGLEFTGSVGIQRSAISGDITIAAGSNTSAITAGVIVDADINASAGIAISKLATQAALSVLANATNATAVPTAVTATADGQVLMRSGTTLVFGSIAAATIPDGSVTYVKIQNGTGLSLLGRSANTSGVLADIVGTAGQVPRVNGTTLAFGSIDLSLSATVGTSKLAVTNIADIAGLSVLGRSASTTGAMAAITGTANQVLMVNSAGTALTFASLAAATIPDGTITLPKLANSTALSLIGRASNTSGPVADITAANDAEVMRRSGTTIGFGTLATGAYTNASVTYAKIQNGTGLSVVGRSANTAGVNADIVGTDGQVFRVSGTTLGFGTIATAGIGDNQVTLAKLATQAGLTVLANATNAITTPTAFAASAADQTLVVNSAGTALTWGQIQTGGIGDAQVTVAKLANLAGLSVLGRSASTTGAMAAITGTANQVLTVNSGGTALVWATISATNITNSTITLAKLANATALSVLGRSANSAGAYADIAATSTSSAVLRESGGTIGFGTISTAGIGDNQVTLAKFATQAALTVLANATNATAVPTAVAAGSDGQVFLRSGTTLAFGTITAAGITNSTITLAKLANGTACSVLGRSANSTGVYADISLGTNDHVLMRTSNVVTSGFIANANVSVTAAIAGTKISPDFGSQNITTTGFLSLGTSPSSSGIIRLPNNEGLFGKTSGGTDVPLAIVDNSNITYLGSSAGADTIVRGLDEVSIYAGGTTAVVANNNEVLLIASSGAMVHAVDLGGARRVLGLLGTLTTTQMPANTGDSVIYIANASVIPSTGNPVNGYILYGTSNGLYIKGPGGTITQIALP